jgi:hypothetical protein
MHRPDAHPWQVQTETEALVCQLRRAHPRWGPRLHYELGQRGMDHPLP